ncbi:MAG TPA: MurT ligase domain-containing protein [Solirubrobacteraceae bacterium]|nr:MurT ligase domain-containing protein [Solirubrobacteraceae bacterium]
MSVFAAKAALARAAGVASRRSGRGATSLPGTVLLALDPTAIARLAAGLPRGSVVISATNGKTTTAALSGSILARAGVTTVDNFAGANMAGGIASALLAARTARGPSPKLGLFEVDEFWLASIAKALRPRVVVLANLFRDQLDRYGELETIAERWAGVVAEATGRLVLGADDPLVAALGADAADPIYFGIEDESMARPAGLAHAADSKQCRRCGGAYEYERVYVGHLGVYACPNCGERRPRPHVSAHAVCLDGVKSARFELRTPAGSGEVELSLPGLYNVYNALAAAALATALEIPLAAIIDGLAAAAPMFGRGERVTAAGHELQIMLMKNPAGANELLRTIALDAGEHHVLAVLNDRDADGRDVSWIWDADFEDFASGVARLTCAGTRAAELALRFKYAGVAPERIRVESDLAQAIDAAIDGAGESTIYALPTYTAMLELREVLRKRGQARSSWVRA